jgi:hypothetical protein
VGERRESFHTPSTHAQAVDHSGVRVGTHHTIGVQHVRLRAPCLACEHHAREVLEVHLVHDSGAWWDDEEVFECFGSPLKEGEALAVALVFEFLVFLDGSSSVWC